MNTAPSANTNTATNPNATAAAAIDTGTAYGKRPGVHDPVLTEVAAGTPMGELLRRYWHPIGTSADAGDTPQRVRVLGEDLILFR
ncbi:MAG: hypothetical protein ABWZ78_07720, partial [Burkholderiaceae bacterium]